MPRPTPAPARPRGHLRLVRPAEAPPGLDLPAALAAYQLARATLLEVVRAHLPPGTPLTLALPAAPAAAGTLTVQGVACADDVLERVQLQVRVEATGQVAELPLAVVLAQIATAAAG